eukprot:498286_1
MSQNILNDYNERTNLDTNTCDEITERTESITRCYHLKDFAKIIQNHNQSSGISNKQIVNYNINLEHLLNSHLNLLQEHQTDHDFESVSAILGDCDISKCNIFHTILNNRTTMQSDGKLDKLEMVLCEIMNSIHCYYYHSFDMGHRPSNQQTSDHTSKYAQLSNHISNCDITHITNKSDKLSKMYCFGYLFDYGFGGEWDEDVDHSHAISVRQHYYSLKEEMINNGLTIEQFNVVFTKAELHFNSVYCRKLYPLQREMSIDNTNRMWLFNKKYLLCLMIYCNFDNLQKRFSKTYWE